MSWFPSFSVEVTHTQLLPRARQAPIQTSQLDNMVRFWFFLLHWLRMDCFQSTAHCSIHAYLIKIKPSSTIVRYPYRQYKLSYTPARFLDVLKIRKFIYYFSSFRCSSHDLEIERGRYTNIDRSNRMCKLCGEPIEDEYHFLLVCHIYEQIRNECLPYKYTHHPNRNKFNVIEQCKCDKICCRLFV